jgi:hypothetical protein
MRDWLDHHLFRLGWETSRGERAHLRAFELLVAALTVWHVWRWSGTIAGLETVVQPLGLAHWVDVSFLFAPLAARANAAVVTLAVLAGALRMGRPAYAVALLGFHLQYVARYSLGKPSHGSSMIGLAVLGLALGSYVAEDALDARRFAFGFTVAFAAVGYASAAACKLIATGPGWVRGEHLALWITERSVDGYGKTGELVVNRLQQVLLDAPRLASATLCFGLISEALAVLAWSRRYRAAVFGALLLMHFGIWWSMDILFDTNIALLLVLGFPWDRWGNAALGGAAAPLARRPASHAGA